MSFEASDLAAFNLATLALAALALVAAAVCDARTFRIPNLASLFLIALFPFYVLSAPPGLNWLQNTFVFVLVLFVGLTMYWRKIAGAGDVKLLAATSLWVGLEGLAAFLFVTAIAGGLLSVAMAVLALRHKADSSQNRLTALRKTPIPYGVAIAVGGLAALMQVSHSVFFSS